jgi:CSS domain containing protein
MVGAIVQGYAFMMRRWPYLTRTALVAASVTAFAAGGHFVTTNAIDSQQARQLEELANIALRRSETAVDFGVATLRDVMRRGPMTCDPAYLQALRLKVYQRSGVKDIRLVTREGSVICSAYSETLEFDHEWITRSHMLHTADRGVLLFRVDQIDGVALGVLKDIDAQNSLVAILGVNANLLDILPEELHDHGEVVAQFDGSAEIARFAASKALDASSAVTFGRHRTAIPCAR